MADAAGNTVQAGDCTNGYTAGTYRVIKVRPRSVYDAFPARRLSMSRIITWYTRASLVSGSAS